jgi:16S rRNA processing protein RimM
MLQKNDEIVIGKVVGVHGIRGHLKIISFTANRSDIFNFPLFMKNGEQIKIKLISTQQKCFVVKIDQIGDRSIAEEFIGREILTPRSNLPSVSDNEYYVDELIGLGVQNRSGETVGTIMAVHNFGAGDIIEIRFTDGVTQMLPFIGKIFVEVTKERVVFKEPDYF